MARPAFPQVHAFLAVARHLSFAGAARELGLTRSSLSQAVRQLEEALNVVLLARTTRSVALTDVGKKLVAAAGPAVAQLNTALEDVRSRPGDVVGRIRLSVVRAAVPLVIEPVLAVFRERHPRVQVEVLAEDRLVDLVAGGFDAGVREGSIVERDMVRVKLTEPFRYLVVGTPKYLAQHPAPQKPEDLLEHDCITFRSPTTGTPYAWELERGKRNWRVPVRGGVLTNDGLMCVSMAKRGLGLAYAPEAMIRDDLARGRLVPVLEAYAPQAPGYFLYFPRQTLKGSPMRLFVDTVREVLH